MFRIMHKRVLPLVHHGIRNDRSVCLFNNLKNVGREYPKMSGHVMDISTRKSMTNFIRKNLPLVSDAIVDWNSLKTHLNSAYELPYNDFARIVIPIAAHSKIIHVNHLISLSTYLKPHMRNESDQTINIYYLNLLTKILIKGRDESGIMKRECEMIMIKVLSQTPNQIIDEKQITRIVVIFTECILSLADSSIENCILALKLWRRVLKALHQYQWKRHVKIPNVTSSKLFQYAMQKSLRTEAIDLLIESNNFVGNSLFDANIEFWTNELKRLNSKEETMKFFEILRLSGNVIDIGFMDSIKSLLLSMGYDCTITNDTDECPHCKMNLSHLEPLSDEQFTRLQNVIVDYWKKQRETHEGSYQEFQYYLKTTNVGFDLVIDTMNVINPLKLIEMNKSQEMVNDMMTQLGKKYRKILLIGKEVSHNYFKAAVSESRYRIYTFFEVPYVLNVDDDHFILLAAFLNPQTHLVSNDMFREHFLSFSPKNAELFKIWMKTHKIKCNDDLSLVFPQNAEIVTKISSDSIHVPVKCNDGHSWICSHLKI